MTAKFVSPCCIKNEAADVQAFCEAVHRPYMRLPVKDESQQAMLCLYPTRHGFIEEKKQHITDQEDLYMN